MNKYYTKQERNNFFEYVPEFFFKKVENVKKKFLEIDQFHFTSYWPSNVT